MTTRVTEGARRKSVPPLFLAFRGFAARRSRARALPLLICRKRGTARSLCEFGFYRRSRLGILELNS